MTNEQPTAPVPSAEQPAVTAPAQERQSPEAWALKKGWPFRPGLYRLPDKSFEVRRVNPDLEGAKVFNRWAVGELLTEAEFDAGCKKAAEEPLR